MIIGWAGHAFPAPKKTAMRIDPLAPPFSAEVQTQFDQLPSSWQPPFEHFKILARDPRLLRAYRLGSVAYLEPRPLSLPQREVFLFRLTGRCPNAFELSPPAPSFPPSPPPPHNHFHPPLPGHPQ